MCENGHSPNTRHPFHPVERQDTAPDVDISSSDGITVLESTCTFTANIFLQVMHNLIKNPNITSSHLFRADIFYDSGEYTDLAFGTAKEDLQKHLRPEYQPRNIDLPQWTLSRTIVRKLIPRTPQLDPPLVQTCHFYHREQDAMEQNLIVYIPHTDNPSSMPFYHPSVSNVFLLHTATPTTTKVSISYALFPTIPLNTKLSRTALRLLQTIHKHGQGVLAGYTKRVHHDIIIPQTRYQDTYSRLKTTYGRKLASQWIEVTDPGKHVFEDIAIAAFLIELWRDMYTATTTALSSTDTVDSQKRPFPGFVDIGCGNGLLVYLLVQEGYEGWGFDARRRKTWETFPEHVQERLQVNILVPEIFQSTNTSDDKVGKGGYWHNGEFVREHLPWFSSPAEKEEKEGEGEEKGKGEEEGEKEGPFIISNHADELTLWTPLLASQNSSSFLALPCCSHDFTGARFRAPGALKTFPTSLSHRHAEDGEEEEEEEEGKRNDTKADITDLKPTNPTLSSNKDGRETERIGVAETGSLLSLRPKPAETTNGTNGKPNKSKLPSSYASLCAYLSAVTGEMGYQAETEVLRIPSTRNISVIGRWASQKTPRDKDKRREKVVELIERESGKSVEALAREWIARAEKLSLKPGSGH